MGCCICATAIQVAYLNPPSIEKILLAYLVDACCITGTGKLGRGSYPVFGSWRRRVWLLLQASGPVCLALGISTGIGGVICVAALVGAGAWAGTTFGEMGGDYIGEKFTRLLNYD